MTQTAEQRTAYVRKWRATPEGRARVARAATVRARALAELRRRHADEFDAIRAAIWLELTGEVPRPGRPARLEAAP
jgi:hypothetical protein